MAISELEIRNEMFKALEEEQFIIYIQPQYNHSIGVLIGAEALVRWKHPIHGLVPPGMFIPIFEETKEIFKLDLYVFEKVCKFIRKSLDLGRRIVPISCNFSRYDFYDKSLPKKLEEIRIKYDVPVSYLRVEATETAFIGNEYINDVIAELHKYGYVVEMDDFGSGYSSLNVLKDIEFDVMKLDMMFLYKNTSNRAGKIVDSVVRMAKWLDMPVIAEGVETVEQADFLKSIGCDHVQGYLYSKPIPEEEFASILDSYNHTKIIKRSNFIDKFNAEEFWSPTSLDTLIFNNFVGGAVIFIYYKGHIETIRVNTKYLSEIGMNMTEKDVININILDTMDDDNKKVFVDMLERAISSKDEEECETWRTYSNECCGEETICLKSNVRVIGNNGNHYIFYSMIRNITNERKRQLEIMDNEKRFKVASEQVNIYFWEYTVATKEMRPCFRCMRDFGLPALLTNYPDSAIEMGIFPPEVADMYRDWHKQIANGVKELEAVIPLTVGRVPFRVRYTTEFDNNGNPIKAYGSAALVV